MKTGKKWQVREKINKRRGMSKIFKWQERVLQMCGFDQK